ncbi:MAG: HD domain-containing protein [Gemmatimonadales bacterium]|nr:HD domain-containing protein [Gemmatimonadales bacterium]
MDAPEIERLLAFLRAAEALKNVTRTSWTSSGQRESVAEHSWRLCLMALVFQHHFPEVDFARLLKICIVHDLGEAVGGDISAVVQAERQADSAGGTWRKSEQERTDLLQLLTPLPDPLQREIVSLWEEYESATSPEARLAKGLDKLETILQHNQGANPAGFDYRFNLAYGRQYTADDPVLAAVRAVLDEETEGRAEKS